MEENHLLYICHECDALHNVSNVEPGTKAICVCCGTTLFKNPVNAIDKPLALVISSLILFLIANIYPIMSLNIAGIERAATLTDSALIFLELGSPDLAVTVWLLSVFIPGVVMIDVFLLGVLVALVKLVALADILLGSGFYALVLLIFSYAATSSSFEPHVLWQRLSNEANHVE